MKKEWHLQHSKEGFSISVQYRNALLDILETLASTIAHNWATRWLPAPLFPIVHYKDDYCDDKPKLHFHLSWWWYGWQIETFLCGTVCQMFASLAEDHSKRVLEFPLAEDFFGFDKREQEFITETSEREKEYQAEIKAELEKE